MKWLIPFFIVFAGLQVFAQECLQIAGTYVHEEKHDNKTEKMTVIVGQEGCEITVKMIDSEYSPTDEDMTNFPETMTSKPAGKNPTTATLTAEGFQILMKPEDLKYRENNGLRINFKLVDGNLVMRGYFIEDGKEKHFGEEAIYKKVK